jgi:hypothetical protein
MLDGASSIWASNWCASGWYNIILFLFIVCVAVDSSPQNIILQFTTFHIFTNRRVAWLIKICGVSLAWTQDSLHTCHLKHLWLKFQWRSRKLTQLQSTVHYNMQWVILVCCPLLALGYRRPTADVPLLGFPNCPSRTATTTLYLLCTLNLRSVQ